MSVFLIPFSATLNCFYVSFLLSEEKYYIYKITRGVSLLIIIVEEFHGLSEWSLDQHATLQHTHSMVWLQHFIFTFFR